MSPFLLLGFLLAGLMHVFIPEGVYSRYLSGNNFKSVTYSALFGIPLPLCSCGVLPTAMSLHREGASKGATVSFLIATPQTGIDSIIATYSIMGLPFAITRPIVALFTALLGGQLVNKFDKNKHNLDAITKSKTEDKRQYKGTKVFDKLKIAMRYGFVDMMHDIGRWLIIGLVIASLITVFIPDSFFTLFSDRPLISMLLVLLCAIPMYLCATGSIPIAAALLMKGLSPGTALVLLMAGPAANFASILVINKVLGKRTLLIYLTSLVIGAISFGLAIDYLLPRQWFISIINNSAFHCHSNTTQWFNIICSIILASLLIYAFISRHFLTKCPKSNNKNSSSSAIIDATEENITRIFNIDGMRCIHCAKGVKRAIADVEGIESVIVNLEDKQASIIGSASDADIIKAVDSVGFKAQRQK